MGVCLCVVAEPCADSFDYGWDHPAFKCCDGFARITGKSFEPVVKVNADDVERISSVGTGSLCSTCEAVVETTSNDDGQNIHRKKCDHPFSLICALGLLVS